MIASLLAVALTFTATATGVEKGTPLEFAFVASGSDRDYEAMFVLDGSVNDFCKRLESAGIPRGKPVDTGTCHLWPVGCELTFDPPLSTYLDIRLPDALPTPRTVYTGGSRLPDGACDASSNMPMSVYSLYSLPQSPIVYDCVFDQGMVYGHQLAKVHLKKGERVSFTIQADIKSLPREISLTIRPGSAVSDIQTIKKEAEKGPVSVLVDFSGDLTVSEAVSVAKALATIDSVNVKINGCNRLYFRSFLPKIEWLDRQQRLTQPFELQISEPDTLTFVEEDWSGSGTDPILTPRVISFPESAKHSKTDTCFVYAAQDTQLSRIYSSLDLLLNHAKISTWYVYIR